MEREIVVDGKKYSLEISMREIVGSKYVGPLDDSEIVLIMQRFRNMIEEAIEVMDYAAMVMDDVAKYLKRRGLER